MFDITDRSYYDLTDYGSQCTTVLRRVVLEEDYEDRCLKKRLLERSDDTVFYERMTLLLEAGETYKNETNGRKYALSFAHMLEKMTVRIYPDELIVGSTEEIFMDEEQTAIFEQNCRRYNTKATELFSFDALGLLDITDDDMRFAPDGCVRTDT